MFASAVMSARFRPQEGAYIKFKISHLTNGTYVAKLDETGVGNITKHIFGKRDYDPNGAMMYVVAVICIYGLSILLMIASVIKKDKSDHGLSKYMNDIDKVHRLEKRQEKFKTRLAMQQRSRGIPSAKVAVPASLVPKTLGECSKEEDKSFMSASYGSTNTLLSDRTSPYFADEQKMLLSSSPVDFAPSPDVAKKPMDKTSFITINIESVDDRSELKKENVDIHGEYKSDIRLMPSSPVSLGTLHEETEDEVV